jgi:hypothetical protein
VRFALSFLAVVVGIVLVVVAVRALPPSRADQLATAQRLETLLPLMDELGLDGWHDCATCTPIDIRPSASPAPLPTGQTAFGTMKQAAQGLVPSGRLVEITTTAGTAAAGDHVVVFTAVANSMLGAETGHDLWVWTWHEQSGSTGPGSIDPHWEFEARSADAG